MTAQDIIRFFNLTPHPEEGGYYRETYRSDETIPMEALPGRYACPKAFGTAIYFLLTHDTCSRLHRLPTDEIFHFYLGDPVLMVNLYPDMSSRVITLGSDIRRGDHVQIVIPRGTWLGTCLHEGGRFALMGTTMAPGFDFTDYEAGERCDLIKHYPDKRELIERLTTPVKE